MSAAAAAAEPYPHDRVCSWSDELERLAGVFPSLSTSARNALRGVLESFLREDGYETEHAAELVAALAALDR